MNVLNRADCKAMRSAALELEKWLKAIQPELFAVESRKYPRLIKRLRRMANDVQATLPKRSVGLTTCDME